MRLVKMNGLGNDYVYADCLTEEIKKPSELAVKISDRHFGVGADGLIMICPSKVADFRMVMYDLDGTQGEMCGNGIRCVGKYVYDNGYTRSKTITIETLGGIKTLYLNVVNGICEGSKVDMGVPVIKDGQVIISYEGRDYSLTDINVGCPHAVTFYDNEDIDMDALDISKMGPYMEHFPAFPDRANINYIKVIGPNHLRMRVWERGSGETMACGTGATASAVAAIVSGRADGSKPVRVTLNGGDLYITYDAKTGHAFMEGPATYVFDIVNYRLEEYM